MRRLRYLHRAKPLLEGMVDGSQGGLTNQERVAYEEFARSLLHALVQTDIGERAVGPFYSLRPRSVRWARRNARLLLEVIDTMEHIEDEIAKLQAETDRIWRKRLEEELDRLLPEGGLQ